MNIPEVQTISNKAVFLLNNFALAERKEIILKTPSSTYSFPLVSTQNTIQAELGDFAKYKEVYTITGNRIVGSIEISVYTDEPFIIQCPFHLPKEKNPPYFMIPAFLYGSNNIDSCSGQTPRFDYGGKTGWPISSKFFIRADRSTHNSVIAITEKNVIMCGIEEKLGGIEYKPADPWKAAYPYNGLMLDSSNTDYDVIGFQLGYENAPKRYSHVWEDPKTPGDEAYLFGWIENANGKNLKAKSYLYIDQAASVPDYGKALRDYYYHIHEEPLKRAERVETMEKLSRSMILNGWNEKHNFIYLCDNEDGKNIGDNGWTGGMQVAYPLLLTAKKLDDATLKKRVLTYMDVLSKDCINKDAGLFFEEFRDGKWQVDGWWGRREDCYNWGDKPLHSAYVNGQAAYYLLKSYMEENLDYPHWLEAAKTVIETAIRGQHENGMYPRFFDPLNGNAVDYDGFQSCWFVPAATLLSMITGEKRYLDSAARAADAYSKWFYRGELYGTPMDTHEAVDEEGNLAFIDACVELHIATREDKYIDMARLGLDWEFSWKFPYNTAFSNDPLRKLNWSSCGGSVTSTRNIHIHPMGNLAAPSMYYLYQQTQDTYIADRLRDTCIWGLGIFNRFDKEFGFGLTGQATEQFFFTDALLLPWWKPWDGGVWEAYLPWGPGCVLLSCASDIPDEFFG